MSFHPGMVEYVYRQLSNGGIMNKMMGLAIALISFLNFTAVSNAGETKGEMEKAKDR